MNTLRTALLRYGLVCFLCLMGAACSHYSLGGKKPKKFEEVQTIHVETARNNSYYARLESMMTSAIVEELNSSGMYVAGASGSSDAILKTTIKSVGQDKIRSQPYNTYRNLQTMMRVVVEYQVIRTSDRMELSSGTITVHSDYYNQPNETSSKSDALSYASRDAATNIVRRLTN